MEENKKDITFRFYSVLKDEDAPPYLSDSLIVAADGLGGSGATVHPIDRDKFSPLREHVMKAAFSDMDLECGALEPEYLDELLESMTDEKDDTSALWGSRITIARFIYALNYEKEKYSPENLAKEEVRAELCKFVREGLFATADYFDLKVERSGFVLLPTTLCAYRYVEEKDTVRAEAMWAGDSRLYAFTKDGLKLISRDDEDASGAITNKFDAEKKKNVKLHYEVYEIEKPCVLMAVSDGIFDPFSPDDNFGVENIFLARLAEADTPEAMAAALTEAYDAIAQDDATVSFKAFGFESFEALRVAYADRTKLICGYAEKQAESKKVLEVMNGDPEEYVGYVRQRTIDKYAAISKAIADAVDGGADDLITRMPIIAPTDDTREREEAAKRLEAALEAAFPVGMENLKKALLSGDATALGAIRKSTRTDKGARVIKTLGYIKTQKEAISEARENYERALEKRKALVEKLVSDWKEKLEKYNVAKASYTDPACKIKQPMSKLERHMHDLHSYWWVAELVEMGIEDEKKYPPCKTQSEMKSIMKTLKALTLTESQHRGAKKGLETCVDNYKNAVIDLVEYIKGRDALMDLFDYEQIKHLGFEPVIKDAAPETPKSRLEKILSTRKDEVVESIIEALAKDYDKKSLVDTFYNGSRLGRFREYYRTKNIPMDEFVELDVQLKALSEEYFTVKPI